MLNFDWIAEVPKFWARLIIIMVFVVPLILSLTLKRQYIFQGAADEKPWRNLKVWILFLVSVQVAAYLYFSSR